MVVLVDGAAHRAQGVVAVGEHIGQRKFCQSGGPGSLDDAHIRNVVGGHGVKPDGQTVHGIQRVVGFEDAIGHGALPGFGGGGQAGGPPLLLRKKGAGTAVGAGTCDSNHVVSLQTVSLTFSDLIYCIEAAESATLPRLFFPDFAQVLFGIYVNYFSGIRLTDFLLSGKIMSAILRKGVPS